MGFMNAALGFRAFFLAAAIWLSFGEGFEMFPERESGRYSYPVDAKKSRGAGKKSF
jgi:hypothetical protein